MNKYIFASSIKNNMFYTRNRGCLDDKINIADTCLGIAGNSWEAMKLLLAYKEKNNNKIVENAIFVFCINIDFTNKGNYNFDYEQYLKDKEMTR